MSVEHEISISCEHGQCMLHGGHRAHCACGWWSDCYAMLSDAQRAVDVHLRRSRREDFDALIARSSVGAALLDVEQRGIDAHLVNLKPQPRRRRKKERR
jgi:hypothetical protein